MADQPADDAHVDLNRFAVSGRHDFRMSIASKELSSERTSRLRESEAQARHRRRKDLMISVAFMVGLASTWVICVVVVFAPEFSGEVQQWATSGITSILAGAVGYLAGKR